EEPPDRVETQARVPERRAPVEEIEPRLGARGEPAVGGEPPVEFRAQLRVLVQHLARQLLHDVRFGVLLLLENGVEESPGDPRVGGFRLQEMDRHPRGALVEWHDRRSGGERDRLADRIAAHPGLGRGPALSLGTGEYPILLVPEIRLGSIVNSYPRNWNGSVAPSASRRSGKAAFGSYFLPAATVAASASRFMEMRAPASRLTTSRS